MYIECDLRNLETLLHAVVQPGYQIIVADCPWFYNNRRLVRHDGGTTRFGIGAVGRYNVMRLSDLKAIPVRLLMGEQCHLYMWATMPRLPAAIQVMESWGAGYMTVAHAWSKINSRAGNTILKWINPYIEGGTVPTVENVCAIMNKVSFFGPGYYTGANEELLLLGRKGRPFKHAKGHKARQVLHWPIDKHSRKPEIFQTAIEWMYPQATRRLELFGRRARTGWDVMGNEIKFPEYTSPYIADPEHFQWT